MSKAVRRELIKAERSPRSIKQQYEKVRREAEKKKEKRRKCIGIKTKNEQRRK